MRPPPTEYIRRTRESYEKLGFEPYRWFHAETEPAFAAPSKPLAESRLGMISTAGTYVQGQVAYYYKDDTGIRAIPRDTPLAKIRFSHIMENYLVEARQDPAAVFPSDALANLRADGVIGELADNYYSCMGGIYSQKRVTAELIPSLAAAIDKERIDLLLLVPL
ncbi:MAG: glycine/sarcosine/betaine reductase selenoprotein B family protein [Gammaproteobacteria bacterium]|nr:glycine/sarcosine/betaine reductase selenoprotein B family protein [Gammaproteobacteria bacterium]